jgi:hypothetical protein
MPPLTPFQIIHTLEKATQMVWQQDPALQALPVHMRRLLYLHQEAALLQVWVQLPKQSAAHLAGSLSVRSAPADPKQQAFVMQLSLPEYGNIDAGIWVFEAPVAAHTPPALLLAYVFKTYLTQRLRAQVPELPQTPEGYPEVLQQAKAWWASQASAPDSTKAQAPAAALQAAQP